MKINIKSYLIIYHLITLFLFAFVNYNGATDFEDMVVPFIEGHVIVIHFCIMVLSSIFFILLNINNKIKVDIILKCLLIKCVLDALPFFYDSTASDYFWYYAITLSSAVTYFLYINVTITNKQQIFLKKSIIFFGIIICLQVIYTFFNMEYSYLDLRYKSAMVIPYGGTNIIASILIPILTLIFFVRIKTIFKITLIILFSVSIVLTKSRGGIILTFMLVVFFIYKSMDRHKDRYIKRMLLLILFILIIILLLNDADILTLLGGYTTGQNNITLNSLSSNRIDGWIEILKETFNNNLFFGVGMKSLSGIGSGAHNIILDLVYKCGLVGAINYLIAFINLEKKGRYILKKCNCIYYVMIMIIYVNSLFEVCYFSYACDVMLWMFIGMMMNQYYKDRMNIRRCE